MRNDWQNVKARINVLTSYCRRVKFPSISKFNNRLFALSMSMYGRAGGVEAEEQKSTSGINLRLIKYELKKFLYLKK
jgi:hypothetical protein